MAQGDKAQGAQKSAFWTHSLRDSVARPALDLSQRGIGTCRRPHNELALPVQPAAPSPALSSYSSAAPSIRKG